MHASLDLSSRERVELIADRWAVHHREEGLGLGGVTSQSRLGSVMQRRDQSDGRAGEPVCTRDLAWDRPHADIKVHNMRRAVVLYMYPTLRDT